MKLIWPEYGYRFLVEKDGIYADKDSISTNADKKLYLSTLQMLNVDYKNAAFKFQDGNVLHQKVLYVIKVNPSLNLTTDENLNIKKNVEQINLSNSVVFNRKN